MSKPVKFTNWSKTDKFNLSPCPMFNTLANYKLLPKENITNSMIKKAFNDVEADFLVANVGSLIFKLSFDIAKNLRATGEHGVIEHDISLTREDYNIGNSINFNKKRFNKMVKFSSDGKNFTISDIVKYFKYNKKQSEINNKQLTFKFTVFMSIFMEYAILFCLLDDNNGSIPLKYLKYFFTKEKFPFKYGFKLKNRLTILRFIKYFSIFFYEFFLSIL
jgi:hypothetical protein